MRNTIIIVIVIVVALAVGYFYVTGGPTPTPKSSLAPSGNLAPGGTSFSGREFLRTLVNLESLKLDDTIFSNKVFLALNDFGIPLIPQPKGRVNPFAPIGSEPVTVTTLTQ